jgi:thiol peroxidase
MATTAFQGTPVHTAGDLPPIGSLAPDFKLVGQDLADITLESLRGRRVVLNIFPSMDTGVCAASVRKFNQLAAGLSNTTVLAVSKDLPFAAGRFCTAEGIDNVVTGSGFRKHSFRGYGVFMEDGPLAGLFARAIVIVDENGKVIYTQLVPEIHDEPDYDDAIAVLK